MAKTRQQKRQELRKGKGKEKDQGLWIWALVAVVLTVAIGVGVFLGTKPETAANPTESEFTSQSGEEEPEVLEEEPIENEVSETSQKETMAEFTMSNGEKFTIELYPQYAPQTVANFVKLANSGFYEGLTFHRIMSDFMIQGGGFDEDGYEMDADSIKGEFSANGVDNPIPHVRGVISMARTNVMNSASSQFFIMHKDYPSLNGQYAAFGIVRKGISVVDDICDSVKQGYNGAVSLSDRPVIESITVKEK